MYSKIYELCNIIFYLTLDGKIVLVYILTYNSSVKDYCKRIIYTEDYRLSTIFEMNFNQLVYNKK